MYNLRLTHKEIEMEKIPEAGRRLRELVSSNLLCDYVLLQTCNRAELYYNGVDLEPLDGFVFESGDRAIKHLLRVACGLESFIVGETEILGQVRNAYDLAKREGHCSSELGRHFELAIRVGRKARLLTDISKGNVSIVSLALDHLQELLGDLSSKKAMVIGAGNIGTKVVMALKNRNVGTILIANRGHERAIELAKKVGAETYSLSHLNELLRKVDTVICATSAPHLILTRDKMRTVDRKMVIVDLSIPRNVDETISDLENIKLITFEDLASKASENMGKRTHEVEKVEMLIEQEMKKKKNDLSSLYKYAERVRCAEVAKAIKFLAKRSPEEVIEDLSKILVKKLYHPLQSEFDISSLTCNEVSKKGAQDLGVLLVGHGSRLPHNKNLLEKMAESIKEHSEIKIVEIGFLRYNSPSINEALEKIAGTQTKKVLVLPVFISHGAHTLEEMPSQFGLRKGERHFLYEEPKSGKILEIFYDEPLGNDDKILEIVMSRLVKYLGSRDFESRQ